MYRYLEAIVFEGRHSDILLGQSGSGQNQSLLNIYVKDATPQRQEFRDDRSGFRYWQSTPHHYTHMYATMIKLFNVSDYRFHEGSQTLWSKAI